MPWVSFLHTTEVHEPTFRRLVQEEAPALTHAHHVHPGLLAGAREHGLEAVRDEVRSALRFAAMDADLVICTCSTLGGLAEELAPEVTEVPVLRVDRPMAEAAVASGRPVLVVAALASTVQPTTDLLVECARGREVAVRVELCEGAWPLFEEGDVAAFLAGVEATVRATARTDEIVVLAQASMAPVADRLNDLGAPVLASPRLAVREAARRLAGSSDPDEHH